jgi:hypothetical protein
VSFPQSFKRADKQHDAEGLLSLSGQMGGIYSIQFRRTGQSVKRSSASAPNLDNRVVGVAMDVTYVSEKRQIPLDCSALDSLRAAFGMS